MMVLHSNFQGTNPNHVFRSFYNANSYHYITVVKLGAVSPIEIQIAIFGQKKQIIFWQNHLIFGQAMEKIFGQLISAPPPPKRNWSRTPMCMIHHLTDVVLADISDFSSKASFLNLRVRVEHDVELGPGADHDWRVLPPAELPQARVRARAAVEDLHVVVAADVELVTVLEDERSEVYSHPSI